jgi:hypothetical protein
MAFNNAGPVVTLAPGQAVRWDYNFDFADAGAQFAAPDIKTPGTPAGRLTAFNQAKRRTRTGGVVYSVDIRNDGTGVIPYNLQGGGLAFGLNNFLETTTLAPGQVFNAIFTFGGFPAQDRGARFLGADIKSNDCQVVALGQGKEIHIAQVFYSAQYLNTGPSTAVFNFQGGGFSPGFNNLGDVATIGPGQSQLYRFFFGFPHEDRGAQYAGPDVKTRNAVLVAVSHSKERSPFGIEYYVVIRNDSQVAAAYNLQGGSLI